MEEQKVVEEKKEDSQIVEKLLREKKNWQLKAEQETREKEDLVKKLKEIEEEKLASQQKYKELYEAKTKEVSGLQEKITLIDKEKENEEKKSALRRELEKSGIKNERSDFAISTIDLNQLKYDKENKIVLGVEDMAKMIKNTIPEIFAGQSIKVNHDAPSNNIATIDLESYKKLSFEEQKNPDILKKLYASHGIEIR